MDPDKTELIPPSALPNFSPGPLGMPPGMFPDSQAELRKANWALGLGVASFFCTCFTFIPALIVGWPVMKRGQNPDAKSRAKLGIILGAIALALNILFALASWIFTVAAVTAQADYLERFDQEVRLLDQKIREPENDAFDIGNK